jgi:hypothetical protein
VTVSEAAIRTDPFSAEIQLDPFPIPAGGHRRFVTGRARLGRDRLRVTAR